MSTIDITRLTPTERLDLIARLWDSLASEDVSLSAAQEAELASRLMTFDDDAKAAVPWAEIDADFGHPQ